MTLKSLIKAVQKLTDDDFHLQGLYGSYEASSCTGVACKNEDVPWFSAKTPEGALEKLLKYLEKQAKKK